jgi:hypothetical protein
MATCEICGTEFDDRGVQIVLPGLAKSYDRLDCAVRARKLAGAAAAGVPMRGMLVDLGRSGGARSFALGGLSAGLAAALAGSRARVAVGGATVGVALLIATTAHLATRGGDGAEATSRPQSLAPPARDAGDFAYRARATEEVARTAAEPRATREVRFALLAATRSADAAPSAARSIRSVTRTRTQRPKATRHARHATRGKTTSTSNSAGASTRPGWGHGDTNHGHSGPSKHSQAKSHKSKKK